MHISGTVNFAVPQQVVWQFLVTPEKLSTCTPNLKSWQTITRGLRYKLLLTRQLGRTRQLRVPVEVEWRDLDAPRHLTLLFSALFGEQVVAARGEMDLAAPTLQATELTFWLTIDSPNNIVAQMARNVAPRFAESLFRCVKHSLEGAASDGTANGVGS